jgi:hypothetical protein
LPGKYSVRLKIDWEHYDNEIVDRIQLAGHFSVVYISILTA